MEGPLVSDTTEFLSGAADAPGETPLGRPASAGNADPEGPRTGSSAPAGSDGAAAAKGRRRQGTGLSALLLPELQQVAHQMGIPGTARMRKSQLIAAIQEKQGGSTDRSSRSGPDATATEVSAPRAASAGADVSRPVKQDAMEPQTSPETGSRRNGRDGGNGVQSSSPGDAAVQQLSFDQAPAGDAAAPGARSRRARRPLPPTAGPRPPAVTASRATTGHVVTAAAATTTPVTPATVSRPAAAATTAGTMAVTAAAKAVTAAARAVTAAARAATAGTAATPASRPPRSPVATSPTTTTMTAPAAAAAVTGSVTATGAVSAARAAANPSRRSAKTTC